MLKDERGWGKQILRSSKEKKVGKIINDFSRSNNTREYNDNNKFNSLFPKHGVLFFESVVAGNVLELVQAGPQLINLNSALIQLTENKHTCGCAVFLQVCSILRSEATIYT